MEEQKFNETDLKDDFLSNNENKSMVTDEINLQKNSKASTSKKKKATEEYKDAEQLSFDESMVKSFEEALNNTPEKSDNDNVSDESPTNVEIATEDKESSLESTESADDTVSKDESSKENDDEELTTNFGYFGDFYTEGGEAFPTPQDDEDIADPDEEEILDGQIKMDFGDSAEITEVSTTEDAPKKKIKNKKYDPDHPRIVDTIFDFAELFIFALVAVLVFTTFFFRHSVVEGSSMENTLLDGEHLIISNLFYTPERGDIIVCEDYSTNLRKPIVKRVIAVAGDHIQVTTDGKVTLNGKLLEENYVHIDGYVFKKEIDEVIPEGKIFVMGDHRNMSTDSREFGTVDTDSIIGKVLIRFYPVNKFGPVE